MQLTVEQLYKNLAKAMLQDPNIAKKFIVVADDNEGNGYHGLFYGLTYDQKNVKECIEFSNGLSDSQSENLDEIVILG